MSRSDERPRGAERAESTATTVNDDLLNIAEDSTWALGRAVVSDKVDGSGGTSRSTGRRIRRRWAPRRSPSFLTWTSVRAGGGWYDHEPTRLKRECWRACGM